MYLTTFARISLSVLLLLSVNIAVAKDTITWGVGNLPPRLTFDGHKHVGGQGGIQQEILVQGLADQYKAEYLPMNWARFESDAKEGKQVCSAFLKKTPVREEFLSYSVPIHIDLAHRIVMHKDNWEKIGKPDSVSLESLLNNGELVGLIEKGRSFGPLDKIINSAGKMSNLRRGTVRPLKLQNMLNHRRVDYTLEYPYFIDYFETLTGVQYEETVQISISETAQWSYTYVGCPANKWGEKVITQVNKIIKEVRGQKSYQEVLKMIYVEETDRQLLDNVYHNEFIKAG